MKSYKAASEVKGLFEGDVQLKSKLTGFGGKLFSTSA